MKLEVLKSDLKIIEKRIDEFRKMDDIYAPAPEFDRLFTDFKKTIDDLKTIDNELFLSINTSIRPRTNQYIGLYDNMVIVYYKSELELLRTEVEKTLNYILILEKGNSINNNTLSSPLIILDLLFNKFHDVVKQLRKRHNNKPTIDVQDEYDVQDVIHSLLKIYFSDIRPEEYVPKYAGGNSRIDFVLKNEKIAIELKKTRLNLKAKELGEQLIIDTERYKTYPSIEYLYCFVYDPDGYIDNPNGMENDLSGRKDKLNVIVKIEPQ